MAQYTNYLPFTENTNYSDVLVTTQEMYADLLNQYGCCPSKSTKEILCQVDIFLQAIDITGEVGSDNYNLERWQESIKAAYLLLSSFFRLSNDVSPATTVVFPSEALLELERGEQYYSNLTAEYLTDLKNGCSGLPLSFECLKRLLRALNYKNNLDEYDDIAEGLIYKMQVIIGGYKLVVPLVGYWWSSDTNAPLTEGQILATNPFNFTAGGSMTVPFRVLPPNYKFINVAYPSSQATRTAYVNSADSEDNGSLGGGGDLMGAAIVTGAFKQQNGNYVTQVSSDLILS